MTNTTIEIGTDEATGELIEVDNPRHINDVADFLDELGHETLGIAATPHRKLISKLREYAKAIADRKALELLVARIDIAAEALYDHTDPELLVDASSSWEDLDAQSRASWRATAIATLRSVGAIEITIEQEESIVGPQGPDEDQGLEGSADESSPADSEQAADAPIAQDGAAGLTETSTELTEETPTTPQHDAAETGIDLPWGAENR